MVNNSPISHHKTFPLPLWQIPKMIKMLITAQQFIQPPAFMSPFEFHPSSPLVSKPFWFSNLANQWNFYLQLYNCCKALQSAGMPSRRFTAVKMHKQPSFPTVGLLLGMQSVVLNALIYWSEKQCENTLSGFWSHWAIRLLHSRRSCSWKAQESGWL